MLALLLIVTACQSNSPSPATEVVPETQPAVLASTTTPVPPTATPEPTATPTLQPTEPAAQQTTGEFIDGTITSQALAGNLVGDPAERPYIVYVPPSYADGNRRYPKHHHLP